jgi:hypothetical protein
MTASYLYLAGINLRLENRRGCTQRLHDILHVRFHSRFKIAVHRGLDCGPDRLNQRFDVGGGFAFRGDGFLCGFDGAAALMPKHDNQADRQMIDCVLDTSQIFIVDDVARYSKYK